MYATFALTRAEPCFCKALPVFRRPAPLPVFRRPAPLSVFRHPAPLPVFRRPAPLPVFRHPAPLSVPVNISLFRVKNPLREKQPR